MYAVECFVLFDDVSISKDQSQICHRGMIYLLESFDLNRRARTYDCGFCPFLGI